MRSLADAQEQFAYHPATADTAPRHAALRDAFADFLPVVWDLVPDGPEKTLAIRKLQEAQMYGNLAVALTAPADLGASRAVARVLPPGAATGFADVVDAVAGPGSGSSTHVTASGVLTPYAGDADRVGRGA